MPKLNRHLRELLKDELVDDTLQAELVATLQSGVIVNIRNCDGSWCLVDGDGFKGYIEQEKLWGVYPGEKIQ